MNIFKDNEIYIKTKSREDLRLLAMMDIQYMSQDLEYIVNIIYKNKDVALNDVFDILHYYGYDLVSENDVDETMLWLKQIFSQYKKEL